MYAILTRNSYTLACDNCDYVVLKDGVEIFRHLSKQVAENFFKQKIGRPNGLR